MAEEPDFFTFVWITGVDRYKKNPVSYILFTALTQHWWILMMANKATLIIFITD